MIWALLAILGIPIWLLIGVLTGIALIRRAFKKQPGVFVMNVRAAGDEKWPRRPSHGRVVSNVLVINRGAALLRSEILALETVAPIELDDRPKKPVDAVGRFVTSTDGPPLEIAVAGDGAARLDAAVDSDDAGSR